MFDYDTEGKDKISKEERPVEESSDKIPKRAREPSTLEEKDEKVPEEEKSVDGSDNISKRVKRTTRTFTPYNMGNNTPTQARARKSDFQIPDPAPH